MAQQCCGIHAELLRTPWLDRLERAWLASVVLFLMAIILMALVECFFSSPSQRGWLLLGLAHIFGLTWNFAWQRLLVVAGRIRYVRVVVRRTDGPTLFDAITTRLESLATQSDVDFGTGEVGAYIQYDDTRGRRVVKLGLWGDQPMQMNLSLMQSQIVSSDAERALGCAVEYRHGDDGICGRDPHVEHTPGIVLSMRSSPDHAPEDKRLARDWCEDCLVEAMAPPLQPCRGLWPAGELKGLGA